MTFSSAAVKAEISGDAGSLWPSMSRRRSKTILTARRSGVAGRLAVAHFVVALFLSRHCRPPRTRGLKLPPLAASRALPLVSACQRRMIERAAALTLRSSPLPTPSGHLQHRRRGASYAPLNNRDDLGLSARNRRKPAETQFSSGCCKAAWSLRSLGFKVL